MLSATQVEFFRDQGYLRLRGILDMAQVEAARRAAEAEFAKANDPLRRGKWDLIEEGESVVYRLSKMIDRGPAFHSIAMHPKVVGAVTSILGPQVDVCTNRHNMLITKAPRVGGEFAWHQDGYSWGHNNAITFMVLLDEATTANGCLQIIPGMQRHGYLAANPTGKLNWCMNREDPQVQDLVEQAVAMEGAPGDGLLFHCMTPHFSAPNRSDRGRRSLSFAYIAEKDKWLYNPAKDPVESIPLPRESRVRELVTSSL